MTQAFVIIDVQNAVLSGKGTLERQPVIDDALNETVIRLRALQDKARETGALVILVQHDGDAAHRLAVGSKGWAIRDEIAPKANEVIVRKKSPDSFFETDLADRLSEHSVTSLVIAGCMSQFCVDTTARRAVSLGYDVTLVSDGHMTGDSDTLSFPQIMAHHNATLDGFNAGKAKITVLPAAKVTF